MTTPAAAWPIDADVVRALLRRHAPDHADLPLRARYEGWDNVTWRLGDSLAVRLPRIPAAEDLLRREQRWVPELSPGWPFEVPTPVLVGPADAGFEHPWSLLRWVDGDDAATAPLAPEAAAPLAEAMAALHRPAPASAPDTPWRTGELAAREGELREALGSAALTGTDVDHAGVDHAAVEEVWTAGRDVPGRRDTWVHADLHAGNVVVRDGMPVGVLDWGELCAGDPAIDVAMAWALLPDGDAVQRCLERYARLRPEADGALHRRARAHALLACAVLAAGTQPRLAATGRRGLALLGVLRSDG